MVFSYVNLQRSAVPGRLGGWTHICGVVDALRQDGIVKVVSYQAKDVAQGRDEVVPVEMPWSFHYFFVAKFILLEKDSAAFVFRKTLLGMYIASLLIILKKFMGGRQRYYIEFNGVSGDFAVKSKVLHRVLLFINAFPLFLFDGVYCVNDNIRRRMLSTGIVNNKKIFVCKNGGGRIVDKMKSNWLINPQGTDIFYYGSARSFYHLSTVVLALKKANDDAGGRGGLLRLHLVGPDLSRFAEHSDNIFVYGPADEDQFSEIVLNSRGYAWGIIPLNDLGRGRDVEPIKTFDYMRMGLPLIHSCYCLEGFDVDEKMSKSYDPSQLDELAAILLQLAHTSLHEYTSIKDLVLEKYSDFLWENRLLELRRRVRAYDC